MSTCIQFEISVCEQVRHDCFPNMSTYMGALLTRKERKGQNYAVRRDAREAHAQPKLPFVSPVDYL